MITNLRMDLFLLRSYLAVGEVEVTVRGPGTQYIIYAESEIISLFAVFAAHLHSALRHVTSATRMLQFIGFAQEIRAYFYKLVRIISHQ